LYLLYLCIPDLVLNFYFISTYCRIANQQYDDLHPANIVGNVRNSFENAFVLAISSANLFLNCVASYEVFSLLKHTTNVKRYKPPSLCKATVQALTVYTISVLVFAIHYCIGTRGSRSMNHFWFINVNLLWSLVVTYISPTLFFTYIWITIWFRGYLKLSSINGKMRELVLYFIRIFVVFYVIWLPGMICVIIGSSLPVVYNRIYCTITLGYIACSIHPIVSFAMVMAKSDVRKFTLNFISLSYLRSSTETKISNTTSNTNKQVEV